ncbi:MAG: metalloregulator ArsR/SmtB family transcription factor [Anaerolineales bacterium]
MKKLKEDPILEMLKALADESRLALLRLLNQGERTVGDLAHQVDLGEPTVSHHLARLRQAGFVTLRMAGNHRFYRVNDSGLARFKQLAAEIEQSPPTPEPVDADDQWITTLGWSAADQRVLRRHTLGRQLIHLPTKQKNLLVILRWLATLFEPERLYSEAEVNTLLKAVYAEDYVGLRRDLVDMGYLRRERGGGKYWLTPAG